MQTTNPIRIRLSRFLTDRYAYRSQPGYSFELVAFGIIVFTAIWPVVLVANAMAAAVNNPIHLVRMRNYFSARLNFHKPAVMPHQVRTYRELRQQIHHDLRTQHPEWVQPGGDCPLCDSYEARLVKLLDNLTGREESRRRT
jgi:hypothetical protein